jgi:hypothetical protein
MQCTTFHATHSFIVPHIRLYRIIAFSCSFNKCMSRRKIRLIEDNAKCPHLKKFTCTGTLRQVFICLRLRIPYPPPFTQCIRVYRMLIHTGKGVGVRGRFEPERRKRGNGSQSWVENTNITGCVSSL